MESPDLLFERWYVKPLEALRKIPNGDGGFIALATSCFLYERFIIALINHNSDINKGRGNDNKIYHLMEDFNIDNETAKAFWEVIRDGLLHSGMPKQADHGKKIDIEWGFMETYIYPIELIQFETKKFLRVQPWLFMEKVINLWKANINLIDKCGSFPWANIRTLPY